MDEDKMELLERRLSERVAERVRPALFRVYATIGAAVIATLGFISWDIVSDIKAEVKKEINDSIAEDIKQKRTEIAEMITETRFMAKQANEVITLLEKKIKAFEPQADQLDKTIDKVDSLNVDAQNLIAMYSTEVRPLRENIESLSSQLKVLAKQVKQINLISEHGAGPEIDTPRDRDAAILTVISGANAAEQRFKERNRTTVFFQFAGARRGQAEELSNALKGKGYIIPGEDRETAAARKHEVRYFHSDDKNEAERLAKDTTEALRRLGYPDESLRVNATSFISYARKKPKPGVIELWIELPYLSNSER